MSVIIKNMQMTQLSKRAPPDQIQFFSPWYPDLYPMSRWLDVKQQAQTKCWYMLILIGKKLEISSSCKSCNVCGFK